jgi:hypothetical protein
MFANGSIPIRFDDNKQPLINVNSLLAHLGQTVKELDSMLENPDSLDSEDLFMAQGVYLFASTFGKELLELIDYSYTKMELDNNINNVDDLIRYAEGKVD